MVLEAKARLRRSLAPVLPDPESDAALARRVLDHPACQKAQRIFCFVGQEEEIDTRPLLSGLLEAGKTVFVPVSLEKGQMLLRRLPALEALTEKDYFGIEIPPQGMEETGPEGIDTALIPGLCFTRDGSRLGRGGGYYDRFLARFTGVALGLCREERMVDKIPMEQHDCRVDQVITPAGCYGGSGQGEKYGGRQKE